MNGVLLDTVGILALWNAQDQWHDDATAAMVSLRARQAVFWTTSLILIECGNAAARTPFRRAVFELREQFIAGGKLINPTEADMNAAWEAYRRGEAGGASIVDHLSFIVMHQFGVGEAFTNDRHFKAAGFATLF